MGRKARAGENGIGRSTTLSMIRLQGRKIFEKARVWKERCYQEEQKKAVTVSSGGKREVRVQEEKKNK